jgi:hypothetical protein
VAKATNFVFKIYYLIEHDLKRITQCPICGSKDIIRKGKRKLKDDIRYFKNKGFTFDFQNYAHQ